MVPSQRQRLINQCTKWGGRGTALGLTSGCLRLKLVVEVLMLVLRHMETRNELRLFLMVWSKRLNGCPAESFVERTCSRRFFSKDLEVFTVIELIVVFTEEPREHLLCLHSGSDQAFVAQPRGRCVLTTSRVVYSNVSVSNLTLQFLFQSDLCQDAHQQFVDVMVDHHRNLHEFTAVGASQALPICTIAIELVKYMCLLILSWNIKVERNFRFSRIVLVIFFSPTVNRFAWGILWPLFWLIV